MVKNTNSPALRYTSPFSGTMKGDKINNSDGLDSGTMKGDKINNSVKIKGLTFFRCSVPLCFVFFSSCISINLDSIKDKPAKGVVFQAPPAPYKLVPQKKMDARWENPADRTALSFFSNCSAVADYTSLKKFQQEILTGLPTFYVTYKKKTSHQNQEAYYLQLKSRRAFKKQKKTMELFLFKKDKCFYALSFLSPQYRGRVKKSPDFKVFVQRFSAP